MSVVIWQAKLTFLKLASLKIELDGMSSRKRKIGTPIFLLKIFCFPYFLGHAQMCDMSIPVNFYCKCLGAKNELRYYSKCK